MFRLVWKLASVSPDCLPVWVGIDPIHQSVTCVSRRIQWPEHTISKYWASRGSSQWVLRLHHYKYHPSTDNISDRAIERLVLFDRLIYLPLRIFSDIPVESTLKSKKLQPWTPSNLIQTWLGVSKKLSCFIVLCKIIRFSWNILKLTESIYGKIPTTNLAF